MKTLLATVASVTLLAAAAAHAESTVISPNGSRPAATGKPDNFWGTALVDPLYSPSEHTNNSGSLVTFAPGARTVWHEHPAGQTIIIVSGLGWVQEEGGEKREVRPGDVVWFPPNVKHWHGASAANSMSHIAITNVVDGENVTWFEQVTDEQYAAD